MKMSPINLHKFMQTLVGSNKIQLLIERFADYFQISVTLFTVLNCANQNGGIASTVQLKCLNIMYR